MSAKLRDRVRLVHLSAQMIAGRRYWLVPFFVLVWPFYNWVSLVAQWSQQDFSEADAQGWGIGVGLVVLAIGLGVRVIAGEIDRRTLEIAYTIPGGTHRIWTARIVAALIILLAAEAVLAAATFLFFTEFPPGALYGAFQAGAFYLVASMALSALFKSEATGAMVSVALLILNGFFTGFGQVQLRISPFFNPAALSQADPVDVAAWTVQNRIAFLLIIAAVIALAFRRAERREKMLGG